MNAEALKKYIYEHGQIEFVLDSIGCKYIKYSPTSDMYTCTNYNGDNKNAVNVRNNKYLSVRNWTRQNEFNDKADIFNLVEYNKDCDFNSAVLYLHNLLGIKYTGFDRKTKRKYKDPLDIFKQIRRSNYEIHQGEPLDEDVINDYFPIIHVSWFKEGIMPWTAKKFSLCYSYKHKRIIIPHYHWLTGQLMGLNMRTTVESYDEFGIRKYCLSPNYQKSLNVYGLYQNKKQILRKGYVVIFESEKSVLKRDSLNDGTGVAISGKNLSEEQAKILIGLNVNIVVAMDKDVDELDVWNICDKFYNIRPVYFIKDKYELLGKKDSPADKGDKKYKYLLKHKILYDESKHEEYLRKIRRK